MTRTEGRIGLRYDPERRAPGDSAERDYASILEHAEEAEAAGIDVLWVAERPFSADAMVPAAFPLCAALAARTARVRIATGVVPLPLHHPLRVAEDAATLDLVSGGRFELGVGLGGDTEGFGGFGVPVRERVGRLEEAIALLRQAWDVGAIAHDGRHHTVEDVEVHPKPKQVPHPPLWIAAHAGPAVERAARLQTGLLTGSVAAATAYRDAWSPTTTPARVTLHVPLAEARGASFRWPHLDAAESDVVVPAHAEGVLIAGGALRELVATLRASFAQGEAQTPASEGL